MRVDLNPIRLAVLDVLRDQNGGTAITDLRERVCSIHMYPPDLVREVIMELIQNGSLRVDEDRKIHRR